jgi:hypothetical protein
VQLLECNDGLMHSYLYVIQTGAVVVTATPLTVPKVEAQTPVLQSASSSHINDSAASRHIVVALHVISAHCDKCSTCSADDVESVHSLVSAAMQCTSTPHVVGSILMPAALMCINISALHAHMYAQRLGCSSITLMYKY